MSKALFVALLLLIGSRATAQDLATPTADVDAAIRKQLAALQAAFDAADPAAAGALFLEKAEWIDENGTIHIGRDAIGVLLGGFFQDFPGAKMEVAVEEVRQLGRTLAMADVVRTVKVGGGGNEALTRSTVTFALEGNAWLIASALDDPAEDELSPHAHLEQLAWLIGEWIDEGSDSLIEIKYEWSEDGNFLLGHYKIIREGLIVMNSQQRIGWDPLAGKIRSWLFDSDGGYGQGEWTRVDDRWVVKTQAVTPDGTTGSATFIMQPDGADRFTMTGLDRILGDEVLDDVEVKIVRKPAQK